MITSNHVHLLIKDTGPNVIADSMQLIAGRTAQEYNQRKDRQGAFWEDRYHATAIEADEHLHRCLIYIDLNMVRAGVVSHPGEWAHSGYREIQEPPKRYAVIDLEGLAPMWRRGYGRWVRDVLVWTKAPLIFRIELVAVDGLAGEAHSAEPGFTRPRPDLPVVEPGRGE